MKINNVFFIILLLLFNISCDDESKDIEPITVECIVTNNSSYEVKDFCLELVDAGGIDDEWNISSIAVGETTVTHVFTFIKAYSGQDVNGNYSCFYGTFYLNNEMRSILIPFYYSTSFYSITINDTDYPYE